MGRCQECGMGMGVADSRMLAFWQTLTAANSRELIRRTDHPGVDVCPVCDSYVLGAEHHLGLPFYLDDIAAYATVNDWDWWNSSTQDCDIRQWPDFGCLSFSSESLASTVAYLRENELSLLDEHDELPYPSELIGPTGIPEDENPGGEWQRQLSILHGQMEGRFSERELDVAVRRLIALLA